MTVGTYKLRIWNIKKWHNVQAVVHGKWSNVSEVEIQETYKRIHISDGILGVCAEWY